MAVSTIQGFGPDKVKTNLYPSGEPATSGAYVNEHLSFGGVWEGCTVKKAMTANRTWEIRPYGMIGRPGETWIERLRALQIYPDRKFEQRASLKSKGRTIVNQKEILGEKLEILKQETSILSEKGHQLVNGLWKIRQIALALWLAAIGVGIGAVSQGGKANPPILAISILIPIWFYYIDTKYNSWYRKFNLREAEIRRFLSQEEYVLPSNQTRISFEKCLLDEKLPFPIYDLSGEQTFGDNGYYKWKSSLLRSYCDIIPLFFYWPQILASVLFSSLEYKNLGYLKSWWFPVVTVFLGLILLYIFAQIKKRVMIRSKS